MEFKKIKIKNKSIQRFHLTGPKLKKLKLEGNEDDIMINV